MSNFQPSAAGDRGACAIFLFLKRSKVELGKVKDGMSDREAELDSYNADFAPRQNTGKPDPRSVIKWSEQAYVEYDWC